MKNNDTGKEVAYVSLVLPLYKINVGQNIIILNSNESWKFEVWRKNENRVCVCVCLFVYKRVSLFQITIVFWT